jgi:hypothetical protein
MPRAGPGWARPAALVVAAGASLVACSRPAPGASLEGLKPEYDSPGAIPPNPLEGTVGAKRFVVRDARLQIDRRPGHEKATIRLSAAAAHEPCGRLPADESTVVWLRFAGRTDVPLGESRRNPLAPAGFEAHVQTNESGLWQGNGDSAALLFVREGDTPGEIQGELSVCFAGSTRSCVSGAFVAPACSSPLDEPPRSFGHTSKEEVQRIKARLVEAGAPEAGGGGPAH